MRVSCESAQEQQQWLGQSLTNAKFTNLSCKTEAKRKILTLESSAGR